jgi:hypothetical protein
MKLSHREKSKLVKVNSTMKDLHDRNNEIYEHWLDDEYLLLKELIKKQIIELKKLLHGLQEDT